MSHKSNTKTAARALRHKRIRAKVAGTATRPRLAVFKSNTAVYAQLIDDEQAKTLGAADSRQEKGSRLESAKAVGAAIAKQAADLKVTEVVFDRGGFQYQGIIAAVAESAREAGLKL
jgi:large subunit ribosomal protein L18